MIIEEIKAEEKKLQQIEQQKSEINVKLSLIQGNTKNLLRETLEDIFKK